MPFTVSHAAAVLPFRRTRLPLSALVIGSFGPDFAYFLANRGESRSWHHYPALVFVCFPFTVLAFYVFQFLMKRPMVSLLPIRVQRRMKPEETAYPRSPVEFALLIAALWIGIGTHIVWDSFTHAYSWPWYHIAAMRHVLWYDGNNAVVGFEVAQTASTVFGLVVLGLYLASWYRRTPEHPVRVALSTVARWTIASCMVVFAFSLAWIQTRMRYPRLYFLNDTYELFFVVSTIAWWMWAAVAYSLVAQVLERRKLPSGSSE